jgi:glycosyltransferase involved in cell wall biosynthesis
MSERARPRLIVIATTYPRWRDDHEPGFVHELCRRLVDRFDVFAVVPHAAGSRRFEILDGVKVVRYRYAPTRLESLVQDGGITTHLRRSPWKWLLVPGFFLMQWRTARQLLKPDAIVHAHWIILPGIVARLLRRPYLITSHGADLFALRGSLALRLKRWVLRSADEATVVSRGMVPLVATLTDGLEPHVAPMGVDLTHRFTPLGATLRAPDHMLFVGRLVEKKGVDVLLAAMPSILREKPNARLSIVGYGPAEGSLRAMVADMKLEASVRFVGGVPQPDLPELYRSATVFVAPFRQARSGDQEGLGLVLVEALGCGCPVVTTDIPAVSDVIDGVEGVVQVTANNPAALAAAVVRVLSTDVRVEVDRGLLRERFDWEHVARRYADLIEAIALRDRCSVQKAERG